MQTNLSVQLRVYCLEFDFHVTIYCECNDRQLFANIMNKIKINKMTNKLCNSQTHNKPTISTVKKVYLLFTFPEQSTNPKYKSIINYLIIFLLFAFFSFKHFYIKKNRQFKNIILSRNKLYICLFFQNHTFTKNKNQKTFIIRDKICISVHLSQVTYI